MTDPSASPLAELESAVLHSRSDRAAAATVDAIRAKVPLTDVVRTTARAFASHYDGAWGVAPRSLVALSSALNLLPAMQPRFHALPVLQAVSFVAAEKKTNAPTKPAAVVSGEITHLGRSFLFAVRDGNRAEAESIFLGMLAEGKERKMAGDMMFRAALEDMGEGGRKLMVAVKSWQLARSLGFKEVRLVLRPAVQYLVSGPRDRAAFETILAALGKEWVDLDVLATGGRPLDEGARTKVRGIAAAPNPSSCIAATLALLRDGYAAVSIAEGLAVEAARRVVAANGYDLDSARGVMFTHAARFVLSFSRTSERLYALFLAALRVRSPEPSPFAASTSGTSGEGEELCHLAGEFDARKTMEAVARTRAYLARGHSPSRLLDVLANYACRDAAVANGGINLIFAETCVAEFLASRAPEIPMALAKMIAASPKDQGAYNGWAPHLPE
ncbi:MAG: hypothetical protein E6K15_05670 [Methanobacteriota archaeon]|nr:MAG: hypothetical protein E6K15_05670 [Euryarchaeota archaeon]